MALIQSKPTSPARRAYTRLVNPELSKKEPEKRLLAKQSSTGGRNFTGRITTRFRGGGVKRHYRLVDFKRNKNNVPGKVAAIEYDPFRSANLALVHYADGDKRYILHPAGLKVGDQVMAGEKVEPKLGNAMSLRHIPLGLPLHNIEFQKGRGGQMVRSAGTAAQLLAKEGDYAFVVMPSGEQRRVHLDCRATIGQVGNAEHNLISIGKAGRTRFKGHRPHVRGVAQNPVSHPLGGGEGRTSGGRPACSPWGKRERKTRNPRKQSKRLIVRRCNNK